MMQHAFYDAVEAFGRAARIQWKGSTGSHVVFDIMVHDGAFSASALDGDPIDRAPIRDVAKVELMAERLRTWWNNLQWRIEQGSAPPTPPHRHD